MCRVLEVSASGYYASRDRAPSARRQRQEALADQIRAVHRGGQRGYGSPRVTQALQQQGVACSENTVARIMRREGIRSQAARKFKATTNSQHHLPVAANVVDRNFQRERPNELWLTDITYIPTREGWLYLAVVLDACTREVVGWSMKERMTTDLVSDALRMAIAREQPEPGLIAHSDRGSQYASHAYQQLLKEHGMICSMSRKGNCWDNAPMESFFGTLKKELIHQHNFRSRREARSSIFDYIECFYNRSRLHSALGYLSPLEFKLAM